MKIVALFLGKHNLMLIVFKLAIGVLTYAPYDALTIVYCALKVHKYHDQKYMLTLGQIDLSWELVTTMTSGY